MGVTVTGWNQRPGNEQNELVACGDAMSIDPKRIPGRALRQLSFLLTLDLDEIINLGSVPSPTQE